MLARIDALASVAASGRTSSRKRLSLPTHHANGDGWAPSTEGCAHRGEGALGEAGIQARSAKEELTRPSDAAAAVNRPIPGFELDADAALAPDDWRWRVRPRRLDGSLGQPVAVRVTLAEAERIRQRRVDGLAARLSWAERAVHVGAAPLRS